MSEGTVVFEGTTEGKAPLIIRYPTKDDTQALCDYMNTLSKEQTFILFQGEEITLEEETNYMKSMLDNIKKHKAVQLLAFSKNELVGVSDVKMRDKAASHEGIFGITVAQQHRRKGIGKKLMECVLKEAEKNVPQLRLITLGVFENNMLATTMYEKFGFVEFGRLPEGILHRGYYVSHIYMYKPIRKV